MLSAGTLSMVMWVLGMACAVMGIAVCSLQGSWLWLCMCVYACVCVHVCVCVWMRGGWVGKGAQHSSLLGTPPPTSTAPIPAVSHLWLEVGMGSSCWKL